MTTGPTHQPVPAGMIRSYEDRIPAEVRAIIVDETIKSLPDKPHIVDLGCGPGLWLRGIADLRHDATLAGYDRDAPMLETGRAMRLTQARWLMADIGTADFMLEPQSADVIAMHFVVHVFPDPRRLLARIRTALKPHGALVLTGWARSSFADYHEYWANHAHPESSSADPDAFVYQRFTDCGRWSLDDLHWLLMRNGFTVRRAAHYTKTYAYVIADIAQAQ